MLIDMHAHSSGISRCCRIDGRSALLAAKEAGIDGLILTNHYQESYVQNGDALAFARAYADEYYQVKAHADELGMPLFFGVEVTAKKHNNAHILLYGPEPEFVLRYPDLYNYFLADLQRITHAEGGIVVHAHPFRHGGTLLDTGLLDGVEINCHPHYDATHSEELLKIAREQQLLVTCGGDYHADTYRSVCGVHFSDTIQSIAGIVSALKEMQTIRLHIHELRQEEHQDVLFPRPAL